MDIIKNYIGGEFCPPHRGEWLDNHCPANGEVYAKLPNSSKEDVDQAVEVAKAAFTK